MPKSEEIITKIKIISSQNNKLSGAMSIIFSKLFKSKEYFTKEEVDKRIQELNGKK